MQIGLPAQRRHNLKLNKSSDGTSLCDFVHSGGTAPMASPPDPYLCRTCIVSVITAKHRNLEDLKMPTAVEVSYNAKAVCMDGLNSFGDPEIEAALMPLCLQLAV